MRAGFRIAVLAVAASLAACGSSHSRPVSAVSSATHSTQQLHLLVPWTRIGDITLGETLKQLHSEYGAEGPYGYQLHGGTVDVEANMPPLNHVNWIYFTTRYYRTKSGFGIGSKIPFGACVKTWTHTCGHRWHGFVWNEVYKAQGCGCWAKVGTGATSLRPSVSNFGKPWVTLYIKHGLVTAILLSSKYVD
jgi:hypothetical protein